ncbi:MAG: CPBP family intramembrane metalloprotease [Ruminococcaceae bacterium]|nr:CPBP family intramembrane metalloprotease [Oscillospiraceae bacterium]
MKSNTKKLVIMVAIIVVFCTVMAIVDGVFKADYFIKSMIKLVLFLILPLAYSFFDRKIKIKELFKPEKSGIKLAVILGISVYAIIVGGYLLVRNFFDFSKITGALTNNIGVTGENFIFVSLYISLVNSLLEEFFFRGFAFLTLKRVAGRNFAYLFSALVFAVYHIAMMIGWFDFVVFLIVMAGLFAGGLIFNYLNEKRETIYPSWLVHMFANFAINTIGFMLFGII